MKWGRSKLFQGILVVVSLVVGLGFFMQSPVRSILTPTPEPTPMPYPQPQSPADDIEFTDSDLTIAWEWYPDLSNHQRFVVRIASNADHFQEIWTGDRSLDIQQTIDSFSLEVGIISWQVAVINVDENNAFHSMASEWSPPRQLRRVRRLSLTPRPLEDMSPAARYFYDFNLSPTELIDSVHRFIQSNSILDQQRTYNADYSDAIELMFNYAQGNSDEQPYLQCDGRSTAMHTTLKELGIESRLVFLYRQVPGYLSQHTTLEVFNPDTQRWQVHDLNWDFYYLDTKTNERASAERILFGSHDTLVECPMVGGDCSYDIMLESVSYFNALRYGYTFEVFVNPDRFELSTRFEGQEGKNLAEFISGGNPSQVTFRLNTWH